MSVLRHLFAVATLSFVSITAAAGPIPMNEFLFKGNTKDTGTKALTMTTYGGGTLGYSQAAPAAAKGQAISFSGNNWVQATGSNYNNVKGDFSVSFWMKTNAVTGAGGQWWQGMGLVDAEYAGVTTDWGISLLDNRIAFGMGQQDTTLFSKATVNDNQWHLVSATWSKNSGAMALYLDGVLNASTIATSAKGLDRIGQSPLTLGGMAVRNNGYTGMLAHVQVFDTVLSAADVAAIKSPAAVPEPASLALLAVGAAGLLVRRRKAAKPQA